MDLQNMLQRAGLNSVITIVYATLCFKETAEGTRDAIIKAGLPRPPVVEITQQQAAAPSFTDASTLHLVLGAHILTVLPRTYIVFNLEQLSSRWITKRYMLMMSRALVVCDFSAANVQALQRKLPKVFCCKLPLYVPVAAAAPPQEPSFDVLFYGCENERRVLMLQLLQAEGLQCHFELGYALWGETRDELVSSAKVVLNLHYYEGTTIHMLHRTYHSDHAHPMRNDAAATYSNNNCSSCSCSCNCDA
jgi:hypothetical protein